MTLAPETEARNALIAALKEVYAAEEFDVRSDRLHKSLGDRHTVIGVSPEVTAHSTRDALVSEMRLLVQFYGYYKKEVNREQTVDPSVVEAYAERLREKLRAGIDPKTPAVWYFMLERITFPPDPTYNQTRFEAVINARGNNTALMETV